MEPGRPDWASCSPLSPTEPHGGACPGGPAALMSGGPQFWGQCCLPHDTLRPPPAPQPLSTCRSSPRVHSRSPLSPQQARETGPFLTPLQPGTMLLTYDKFGLGEQLTLGSSAVRSTEQNLVVSTTCPPSGLGGTAPSPCASVSSSVEGAFPLKLWQSPHKLMSVCA